MCGPKAAITSRPKPLRDRSREDTASSRPNLQVALGTLSFTFCFAAWGLISAFAPRFREAFHLTATQTAFLVAVPVLLGALLRIATGMLADRFEGQVGFCAVDDYRRRARLCRVPWRRFGIRVKSGHKAVSNGSGCGLRGRAGLACRE
jgi:MFS family permease